MTSTFEYELCFAAALFFVFLLGRLPAETSFDDLPYDVRLRILKTRTALAKQNWRRRLLERCRCIKCPCWCVYETLFCSRCQAPIRDCEGDMEGYDLGRYCDEEPAWHCRDCADRDDFPPEPWCVDCVSIFHLAVLKLDRRLLRCKEQEWLYNSFRDHLNNSSRRAKYRRGEYDVYEQCLQWGRFRHALLLQLPIAEWRFGFAELSDDSNMSLRINLHTISHDFKNPFGLRNVLRDVQCLHAMGRLGCILVDGSQVCNNFVDRALPLFVPVKLHHKLVLML